MDERRWKPTDHVKASGLSRRSRVARAGKFAVEILGLTLLVLFLARLEGLEWYEALIGSLTPDARTGRIFQVPISQGVRVFVDQTLAQWDSELWAGFVIVLVAFLTVVAGFRLRRTPPHTRLRHD